MSLLDVLALAVASLALGLLVAAVVRVVRADGYGHRPPPLSHHPWHAEHEPY